MIKIKIDNKEYSFEDRIPVIDAARKAGKDIPSMCYREGKEHITSCMICLVKDRKNEKLFPSCSLKISEGMDIVTMNEEIREARKTALELLLSEHVGDCEAPCQLTCPAHMNIPLMNRHLAAGRFEDALRVVKRDIALPSVFGRVCPAPCEGACYRKTVDDPVSICLLKRYAGDHDLMNQEQWIPEREESKGKSVAIIGAGPAGLACAWYLQIRGYDCKVYDRNESPGGSLHSEVESGKLPQQILEKDTSILKMAGVKFLMKSDVNDAEFEKIKSQYDAVVVATGQDTSKVKKFGLEMSDRGIKADSSNYQINNTGIFVTGSALRPSKMAIRTLGQGKEAAFSVSQYLEGKKVVGEKFRFNSRFGKLAAEEVQEYMKEATDNNRLEPEEIQKGFSRREVMKEAARCMHCDCRDLENCKLRIFSDQYSADQKRFKSPERKLIVKQFQHDRVIFESAKCIRCGVCVEICREYREDFGFTFIGRGFEIEVGIPFNEELKEGLAKIAEEVVRECPTGALAWWKDREIGGSEGTEVKDRTGGMEGTLGLE